MGPPSASPGAHAQHEDFEMGSPAWQRTPASPVSRTVRIQTIVVIVEPSELTLTFLQVFNNHPPEPVHRTSKVSCSLIF